MKISFSNKRKILPPLCAGLLLAGEAEAAPNVQMAPGAAQDTTADFVFGQLDFVFSIKNFIDKSGLNLESGIRGDIAVDKSVTPNRVYVTDRNNHRVLFYKTPFSKGRGADDVFGQYGSLSDNTANNFGLSEATLSSPVRVVLDAANNLYVADQGNNRVLKFNSPLSTDRSADAVFGQGNRFNTSSCKTLGPDSLCGPDGIAIDAADNLYVADTTRNRVLEYLRP